MFLTEFLIAEDEQLFFELEFELMDCFEIIFETNNLFHGSCRNFGLFRCCADFNVGKTLKINDRINAVVIKLQNYL